jgi:hypothetical protein
LIDMFFICSHQAKASKALPGSLIFRYQPLADPQLLPRDWVFMPLSAAAQVDADPGAENSSGSAVATRMIQILQITVDGRDGDRTFSNPRGHALHRPSTDVADRKDSRSLRFIG